MANNQLCLRILKQKPCPNREIVRRIDRP
jgi:hypothetical protein